MEKSYHKYWKIRRKIKNDWEKLKKSKIKLTIHNWRIKVCFIFLIEFSYFYLIISLNKWILESLKNPYNRSIMKIVKTRLRNRMGNNFLIDSLVIYIKRQIAKTYSVNNEIIDNVKVPKKASSFTLIQNLRYNFWLFWLYFCWIQFFLLILPLRHCIWTPLSIAWIHDSRSYKARKWSLKYVRMKHQESSIWSIKDSHMKH